jgi:hypothetical protein
MPADLDPAVAILDFSANSDIDVELESRIERLEKLVR